MCGIVGLHLRSPELYPRLGELLTGMLCEMEDRGADSAGVAVYGDPTWSPAGCGVVSLLEVELAPSDVATVVGAALGATVSARALAGTTILTADVDSEQLLAAARAAVPTALVAGFGADLAVLKGVGSPRALAEQWGLARASGWQGVGHTRMATESAVTPSGAHPYAVGPSPTTPPSGASSWRRALRSTRSTTPRSVPASSPTGWRRG